MARRTFIFFGLLLTVCNSCELWAQSTEVPPDLMEMSLADLMKVEIDSVYGASGYKQKITEAPASITIVTADDIRRYGYRTLADVLRSVPGLYVTYDRNYSGLGVRGFGRPGDYNSRVLLLVDGHRMNDDVYDQASIGTEFPVDIDLIDRVEVIRGPNSSLYVASAFLGVINVITKPARKASGLTTSSELASYGTYKSRLTFGQRFGGGMEMLLSGTYYDSHGHDRLYFKDFDSPATNHGIAANVDGDRTDQLFAKVSYRGLAVDAAYGSREKTIPTASFGTIFNDPGNQTTDTHKYVDLKYDQNFGGDRGFFGRLYYDSYDYQGTYTYDYSDSGGPSRVLNRDLGTGQWWGAEFAFSKSLFDHQTLVAGAEYRDNFRQNQSNFDVQPFFQYVNVQKSSSIWRIYAQDAVRLRRNLVLDLGLRHDQYSTFGGTTNPRAALIYSPLERTTLKLLYGQAFRAPNAYEMFYAGQGADANLDLKPETIKTTELVLQQTLHRDFSLNVSGYFYPIRGLISQETAANGEIVYRNSQRINMQGVEFSLKKSTHSGLEADAGFSLQNAKDRDTGALLTNSPHQLGVANLSVPLFKKRLFASMGLAYVSRRTTLASNYTGAYVVPNFTLLSNFKRLEISASVYNAFSQQYGDPGGEEHRQDVILQDGRNFRLKFAYHF